MKKNIICIACLLTAMTMNAQTVNVHFKNGQTVRFNSSNVDFVDFSEKPADPTLTAGEIVDLGLSVYWASCNLGASKPEEYGNYYAWGETSTKNSYSQGNYTYYDSDKATYIDIGSDISGTEYDAARVNLGGEWRMPTEDEMTELMKKCAWAWTQINGINGFKVTGPNGNSIFLPAAGFCESGPYDVHINRGKRLSYWCSTRSSSNSSNAYELNVESSTTVISQYPNGLKKYYGLSIRPVTSSNSTTPIDHSNDYLVTDKISATYNGGSMSIINGTIQSGSQLNWSFKNGSSESVELTGIKLINGSTGASGNNMLSENVTVAAGETKSYTATVGAGGVQKPKIQFTYRYNSATYTVEASMPET